MKIYRSIIILIHVFWCNADLLSHFQVCSRSDPELNTCLKSAIQHSFETLKKGIPEFNIPSLEPIRYQNFTWLPIPPTVYRQVYTDIKMHNYLTAKILDVDATIDDRRFMIVLKVLIDMAQYEANYEYFGNILDKVDAYSNGTCSYETVKKGMTVTLTGEPKEYVKITLVQVNVTDVESVMFNYESPDDPNLAESLSKYFNDNWKVVVKYEGSKFAMLYAEMFKKETQAIFSKIPFDLLFPK